MNMNFIILYQKKIFLLIKQYYFPKIQSIIHFENNNYLFSDDTFFAAPSIVYQLIITRIYAKDLKKILIHALIMDYIILKNCISILISYI